MADVDKLAKTDSKLSGKDLINQPKDVIDSNKSTTETSVAAEHWTGGMKLVPDASGEIPREVVFKQLCKAFNKSPFFKHCGMKMRVEDGVIKGFVDMDANLVGNVAFQILHGGVAATILDSIGGIVAMGEIYLSGKGELVDRIRQVTRLATSDMRVDYLAPGRGKYFVATAEALRMGRKGCTMRMNLHNDENKLISTAIATYVY